MLSVLWNVLIPILPASFLIAPALWRGICPLATLNMMSNRLVGRRRLSSKLIPTATIIGIVLLFILVPARRFLFNENGALLAATIITVAVAALLLGTVFDAKAGFCNAICPVLPVERLYGQHPLLRIGNPRCIPCRMCTAEGCIDLVPTLSIANTRGPVHRLPAWLKTPYGVFAAAFPGFVIGYYTTTDVLLASAGTIYLSVMTWAGVSYLLTALAVRILNVSVALALTILAAGAAGLYYWFAAPIIASTLGVAGVGTLVIRSAAFVLLVVWFWRAMLKARTHHSKISDTS